MPAYEIGVMIRKSMELEPTLMALSEHGVRQVQPWCWGNELDVRHAPESAADAVVACLERLGMGLTGLCCDTGMGFVRDEVVEEQLEHLDAAGRVCRRMGVEVLSSHIGKVGGLEAGAAARLIETLRRAGDVCERHGVTLASETGVESGPELRQLLDRVDHPRIRVNLDPANLVRRGFDLHEAVTALAPHLVHSHAKDGVAGGEEVPIGEGDVPWARYFEWLAEVGYGGAVVIEYEAGGDWLEQVAAGRDYLRRQGLARG